MLKKTGCLENICLELQLIPLVKQRTGVYKKEANGVKLSKV
jgi:hypothetical protein